LRRFRKTVSVGAEVTSGWMAFEKGFLWNWNGPSGDVYHCQGATLT